MDTTTNNGEASTAPLRAALAQATAAFSSSADTLTQDLLSQWTQGAIEFSNATSSIQSILEGANSLTRQLEKSLDFGDDQINSQTWLVFREVAASEIRLLTANALGSAVALEGEKTLKRFEIPPAMRVPKTGSELFVCLHSVPSEVDGFIQLHPELLLSSENALRLYHPDAALVLLPQARHCFRLHPADMVLRGLLPSMPLKQESSNESCQERRNEYDSITAQWTATYGVLRKNIMKCGP